MENRYVSFYTPLMYLSVFFIAAIVGADILTYKLISFYGLIASASLIFFPLTYAIGDITAEVYGRQIAVKMVLISIGAEFYVDTILSLISHLDSPAALDLSSAYKTVLAPLQKIYWGNIIALALSALMNVMVMSKLKLLYKGRYFVMRSLIATFSSEIVYIIIAYSIWFVGRVSYGTLVTMMSISMSFKIIFALVVAYPSLMITKRILALKPQAAV